MLIFAGPGSGKTVALVDRDILNRDRYGRLLRYVYLADGTMVNLALIQSGHAHAATYPPDVRYVDVFVAADRANW